MAKNFKQVIPLLNRVMIKRTEVPQLQVESPFLRTKKPGKVIEVGSGIREEGKFRKTLVS